MGARQWLRTALVALVVAAPLLLMSDAGAQVGGVGAAVVPEFPDQTTVGETFDAGLFIENRSTDPVTLTVADITLTPACGTVALGCPAPFIDPGVFDLGPVGTGQAGTNCAGVTFAIAETSPGVFTFTAIGPPVVLAPGQACRILFTATTLRTPTMDSAPAIPGVQTTQVAQALFIPTNPAIPPFLSAGVDTTRVNPAVPLIATQANPQVIDVGQSFTDTATVTGVPGSPTPTGTVTFEVFGPVPPPGFPVNCPPGGGFVTSGPVALQPAGPTTATATSPPFTLQDNPGIPGDQRVGNFVVVATYSGDANYAPVTSPCVDPAEQVAINALPTITVDKTATPLTMQEPGGVFTFNVVVTNTSAEPVTITSLTDDVYGNIANQGTCNTAIGTVLAPGGTYSCAFQGSFTGLAPDAQTDTVTAVAADADGNTATDADDATVTLTPAPPTIVVEKTADPLSLPEPGGAFTFDVIVTNTTPRSVTITSLTDNVYGDLNLPNPRVTGNTCAGSVGIVLAPDPDGVGPLPGGSFQCSFVGTFTGNAGAAQTDIVTATAIDQFGNMATDDDDAVVTITDVPPVIQVVKTANPLSLPEPGGAFTFNVVVTNTSNEPVTITSLTDNIYGNIANQGTCTTAIGTVLTPFPGPGNTYSCSFTGPFTGPGGASQTDIVTAVAVDDDGTTATDTDDATVTLTDVAPTVLVDKTATPGSLPEPGGNFSFNVVVTNTSNEPVTITTLTDNIYGNIATQGTCTTAIGTVLPAGGGTYTCSFVGPFTGNAGATQTDIVTAVVVDDEGTTATDSDDAVVTLTDVLPIIRVDKTADPLTRLEPGGDFTFDVVVTNLSSEPVTITTLTDNIYGNLATRPGTNTCTTSIGTVLAASPGPGNTYTCSFVGPFFGNAGAQQTDVVTATAVDNDGDTAQDDDDAVVSITNVVPTIVVDKTATPESRPEPGGTFTFNVTVTNTSIIPLTITSLTDNIYGNIATQGTCTTAIGTVLAANGGSYSCSFTGPFTGNAGDRQTDIVTGVAVDAGGESVTDTDDAEVFLTDVAPSIDVVKTASPLSRPEPGGTFTFDVVVTNNSGETITLTALTDNIYGNIATQGTCTTAIGTLLAPGATYSCAFDGPFTGDAGDTQTDIVTATGVDNDGTAVTDTDDAIVTLTDVAPTVEVVKTATPGSRPEPGGTFTYRVVVTNTSDEIVSITSLTDDVYGDISTQGTCTTAKGTVLDPDETYECTFEGTFTGNAGDTETDVVTVVVTDDDGTTATDDDDAVVTITNVPPTVEVVKTATPEVLPAPGGAFTFNVVVTNTSAEPVTITALTDDIYGNIATQGTCTTAIGTVLAASPGPGNTYSCSFTGSFTGAGGSQTDVVTVIVTDDDNNPATDTDDATVTVTPPPPVGVIPNVITNTVTPTGATSPIAVRPNVTTTTTTTTLAKTGAGVTDLVALGVGLLVGGGLLLLAASRWAPPTRRRPGAGPSGDGWSPAT